MIAQVYLCLAGISGSEVKIVISSEGLLNLGNLECDLLRVLLLMEIPVAPLLSSVALHMAD
jgi:hypothetical protein